MKCQHYLVPYVVFIATLYFGGQCLLWGYKTFRFFQAGGPLREEFATYGVQVDGLIKLLRIVRMPDESEEMDVEIEARLLVELDWFSKQMEQFDIRTPTINPDAIKNVNPWTRYLVELEILTRHRQLKEARELEPEQNEAH